MESKKSQGLWRSIPGFRSYEVSTIGQVRRVAPGRGAVVKKILKINNVSPYGCRDFKLRVNGEYKTISVGRLMALAFLGPPPSSEHCAIFKDRNNSHTYLSNIKWCHRSYVPRTP